MQDKALSSHAHSRYYTEHYSIHRAIILYEEVYYIHRKMF
jgi:hypothetical protein